MLFQTIDTVYFFEDATASVKINNKESFLTKNIVLLKEFHGPGRCDNVDVSLHETKVGQN